MDGDEAGVAEGAGAPGLGWVWPGVAEGAGAPEMGWVRHVVGGDGMGEASGGMAVVAG